MYTHATRPKDPAAACALALFGLLLGCMLALSAFGAQVYRALTAAQARNNASRAALSYVSARLRAADTAGAVALGAGPEGPALLLREEGYETRIYLYEGCLVEEYAAAGSALAPQNAQIIARTGSFSAAAAGGLYGHDRCRRRANLPAQRGGGAHEPAQEPRLCGRNAAADLVFLLALALLVQLFGAAQAMGRQARQETDAALLLQNASAQLHAGADPGRRRWPTPRRPARRRQPKPPLPPTARPPQ